MIVTKIGGFMRFLLLASLLLPSAGWAACASETILACQIGSKQLDVCLDKDTVSYRFGPKGAPELTLSDPLASVAFTPWPGVGGSMWQSVSFTNGDVTYEVWDSIERNPEATEPRAGGINVMRGDTSLARLNCNRGSVEGSVDLLYDSKLAIGQCWDRTNVVWGACPRN